MTVVTLSELMATQRESLRITRASAMVRFRARVRAIDLTPARRALVLALLAVAGFVSRHALVLGGCVAFVVAAAMVSIVLAWVVGGLALFFLEARR